MPIAVGSSASIKVGAREWPARAACPARTDSLVAHALERRDQAAIAVDQREIGDDGARVVAADVDPRLLTAAPGFSSLISPKRTGK